VSKRCKGGPVGNRKIERVRRLIPYPWRNDGVVSKPDVEKVTTGSISITPFFVSRSCERSSSAWSVSDERICCKSAKSLLRVLTFHFNTRNLVLTGHDLDMCHSRGVHTAIKRMDAFLLHEGRYSDRSFDRVKKML
jgi:hypothetical protein